MVDALKKARTFLSSTGLLVDIHPVPENRPIYARLDESVTQIGLIDVENKFAKYHCADKALETVLSEGLFKQQATAEADFKVYFDTFADCKRYIMEEWTNATVVESNREHIDLFMRSMVKEKEIFYIEKIKFSACVPQS